VSASAGDVPVDRDRFAALAAAAAKCDIGGAPAGARVHFDRWLADAIARTSDLEWAASFQTSCPVDGAVAADYQHRWLAARGAPTLLAGIRFYGGDLAFPFVELLAFDQPDIDWNAAVRRLASEFASFAPRAVRVRTPAGDKPGYRGETTLDQVVVGGALSPRPDDDSDGDSDDDSDGGSAAGQSDAPLVTAVATDLAFVDRYQTSYRAWQAATPELVKALPMTTDVEWRHCLERGVIVCAYRPGTADWLGAAAAAPGDDRLVGGWAVWEMFLAASARGRGWAPTLQRALLSAVATRAKPGDCLWGTIDGRNGASLGTARRCGRYPMEDRWFLRL